MKAKWWAWLAVMLAWVMDAPAAAQVSLVTQAQVPAGNSFGPQTPSGFLNIGNDIWFGDEAQGLRHYIPLDPADPTPLETQQFQFDTSPSFSVGGGICIPYCSVGQIAKVNDTAAFVAAWDHAKGQPFQVGGGGIYLQTFNSIPGASPLDQFTMVAPNKGLAGNQVTSLAFGPDGKLYFGNLKNPNLQRITNPLNPDATTQQIEAVGTALNGKPIFAMAFVGSDIYLGTGDGFYVVPNVIICAGNQNNCGRPFLLAGGSSCNAVVADGRGNVYFAMNAGGIVNRLSVATGAVTQVAAGFKFVAGHTNGLGIDRDGNLWIGDNPAAEGTPNGGRLSRILAADLAAVE